ncbi:hypothetical protein C0993_001294 [Termitomyces sp. T159_Od127]|nr:hypothetical protein C0993_001294 [Termitomyces sp. T159_Od127]
MSSARYAPLTNADSELDAAFADDDHDDHEHAPPARGPASVPGAYDFEREYDFPPPGSPPAPSSHALPNDYGNSNGLLPTSAPARPAPPRPSFFRRAVGALLPSHYVRVPGSDSSPRIVGAGTDNDGVFANVVAKPQRAQPHVAPDGSIYMAPEETSAKDVPPSYADAQADAVPAYWETTVHAPSADPDAPMVIDDLPTGSPWLFFTNLFISFFFQFIGFLFTYLLHTSHAAKYGSRAGLGLTLIQFGFYSRSIPSSDPADLSAAPVPSPLPASPVPGAGSAPLADDSFSKSPISSRDWLAFLFMTLGWFVFLSSLIAYIRIKRWERSIRSPPAPAPAPSPDVVERDREIRRNLASVFGIAFDDEERHEGRTVDPRTREEAEAQDARLARDLRAAGLL